MEILQLGVHGCEVHEVSADAIDLPDHQMRELAAPDPGHHLLVARSARILRRVAGILEDFEAVYAESILAVVLQFLPLDRQALLVDLIGGRHSDIQSCPL